jgi:hypothetical protein
MPRRNPTKTEYIKEDGSNNATRETRKNTKEKKGERNVIVAAVSLGKHKKNSLLPRKKEVRKKREEFRNKKEKK